MSAAPTTSGVEEASPQGIPTPALAAAGGLALLGVLAFVAGLLTDAETTWRAFHVNTLFWGALSQGALCIACAFVIVGARWPGPVRRIAEGLSAWVPVTFVLAAVGFLGREHVYPWIEEPLPWKAAWLNVPRLVLTDLGILLVLAVLTVFFLKASVRPTLKAAEPRARGFAKGMIARWTSGWRGEAEEARASEARLQVLAPIIGLAYAFGWSIIAFDQVMSLSPTWFSNLFGAFFAWGGFLSAIGATAVLAVLHRAHPGLEGEITRSRLHDLGKMIFAFSIFWMYLFFAQYLVIWYGNLPEETEFFAARLGPEFLQSTWYFSGWGERVFEHPWAPVTLFAWVCIWVIPFWLLLGQAPKKTSWWLAPVAGIMVFGFWLERNVLMWPSWTPEARWAFLGWIQIGVALGFLGAFALVYLFYTRVFPSLAVPRRDA